MGRRVDLVLGVLNGAVGDHLVQTHNGLATPGTGVEQRLARRRLQERDGSNLGGAAHGRTEAVDPEARR